MAAGDPAPPSTRDSSADGATAAAVPAVEALPADTAGDGPAFDARAFMGKRSTLRFVRRVVGSLGGSLSRAEREDVVSVVLLKATTTSSPPRSLDTAESWLFKVCSNAVKDAGRKRAVQEAWTNRDAEVSELPNPPDDDDDDEGVPILPWLEERKLIPSDRDLLDKLKVAAREGLKRKKDIAARFALEPRALSDRIYDFKRRHLIARHKYLEKQRAVILLLVALLLGGAIVGLVLALWPRRPAPPPPAPPAPVLTATPAPHFDQALPHEPEPAPPPAPPRDSKPTAPR